MSAIIQVRASFGRLRSPRKGEIVCLIGRDVMLHTAQLEAFCFRQISEHDRELVLLAGVVAFADRTIRRHLSERWCRRIRVVMPVGNPHYWERRSITSSLEDALGFLTGDAWSFEFVKRDEVFPKLRQQEFDLSEVSTVVVPYSNGLDSFAQSKLLQVDGFDATPIRITAATSSITGNRDWIYTPDGARYRRVSVPLRVATTTHAEPTYRSRTFVFATLAGLAAHLASSQCVVIPEAGQGSFGPSLVPVGSESPHRGSHPGFTRRMTILFHALWDQRIEFKHPQVWRTKGQVLKRLQDHKLHEGWLSTHSCSQGPRQIRTERRKTLHCGLCAGCLLRRVSIYSAGLTEPDDHYFWPDLNASALEMAICSDARRAPSRNDFDIAIHAVMAMELLARASDSAKENVMLKQTLFEAFDPPAIADAEANLLLLLSAHRSEWRAFTKQFRADAWINKQIAAL